MQGCPRRALHPAATAAASHSLPCSCPPSHRPTERRLLVGDAAPRPPRNKPAIKPVAPSGLLGRLQAFLPALEAANADLQQQLEQQPASEVAMERGRWVLGADVERLQHPGAAAAAVVPVASASCRALPSPLRPPPSSLAAAPSLMLALPHHPLSRSDDEREGPVVELDLACGLFDLKDETAVAAAERAMLAQGVAIDRFEGASTDDSSEEDSSSGSEDEGEGQEQGGMRRQGPAAATAAAAAGAGAEDLDAMQEDEPDGSAGTVEAAAAAAAAGGGQQLEGAAPGRRRKGKQRGSRRHAGIQELS